MHKLKKLVMVMVLAMSMMFTTSKAHATEAPIDPATVANLQQMVAQSVRSPEDAQRVLKVIAGIDARIAATRVLQAGSAAGSSAYIGYKLAIRNMALKAEAMQAGLEMAKAAGYQYAGLIGHRILVGVPIFIGPTDAMLQQLMQGEGYQSQYDSAMYDPTGYYGEFHVGGSLWLERLLNMEGADWGSAWGSGGGGSNQEDVAWSQWSIFDPAEDDPGAVPANYGAAAEAALSGSGITAQSEGPLGPLMLSAGYTHESQFANALMLDVSHALNRPVVYMTVVDGTNIVTVVYPDAYAESHTADGSMVQWHMEFPF
jgi:hypothetical protein